MLAVRLIDTGDDARSRAPSSPSARRSDPLSYPRLGLRLERPTGWTADLREGVVRLRSADGSAGVAVFTAPAGTPAGRLRQEVERGLQGAYREVKLVRRGRATLGGVPASSADLTARTPAGDRVGLAVLAARAAHRTYGVAIFSGGALTPRHARDIELVLASLRYLRPAR